MPDPLHQFIADVEVRIAEMDESDACGLVLVCTEPELGYRQIIGPFPKDTAEAVERLEFLVAEANRSEGPRCRYEIDYLFPSTFAYPGGVRP